MDFEAKENKQAKKKKNLEIKNTNLHEFGIILRTFYNTIPEIKS